MRFRDVLRCEIEHRRRTNRRYSLRGFARFLGVHHATVSRILRGSGPVAARCVRTLGGRLGMPVARIELLSASENEAAILAMVGRPAFLTDSRWIASAVGIRRAS